MLGLWHKYRQLLRLKMSSTRQTNKTESTLTRRGKTIYETNPSVTGRFSERIDTRPPAKGRSAYMIAADGSGEVLGRGSFGFVEEAEVDNEQFVKVYLAGIKQYAQLSKAGEVLFEFVYREISGRGGRDKDTISINFILAQRWKPDLTRRTYERGLSELFEKEFLYRSIAADVYFVNVRFMFNGDRMLLVKSYRRAGSSLQMTMPLEGPAEDEKS